MRIRSFIAIAALVLVPATASAQVLNGGIATTTEKGFFDVGVRGTTTTGDAARYERYRDLGDGLFLDVLRLNRQNGDWLFRLNSNHLGWKDQRIGGRATKQGWFTGWFTWDQIPMLLSTTTRTFFQGDVLDNGGTLTIADSIQAAGGASLASLFVPGNYQEFTTKTRRHIAEAGFQFLPNQDFNIRGVFRNTSREGAIPFGGSFGHSSVVETLAPTNHQLRDVDATAEWARDRYLFRAGYTGSFFHNDVTAVTFDNPWRLTDASGSSSHGRLTLPPSSSYFGINGLASVKLPRRSRATAYVSTGTLKDAGDQLIPNSANPLSNLLPLARQTVDGEASTTAYNLSFTSSPVDRFNFSLRFRSYDYDNQTPEFDMIQRVAYDNSPTAAPSPLATPIPTEPFSVTRHNFDADARYVLQAGTGLGVGVTRLAEDRNHRLFEETVENVFRLTFDTIGNQYFSIRSRYEHSEKRGKGFDPEVLTGVSELVGMRHFDLASRDRNRVTFVGTVTPVNNLMVNLSVAAGNDDYLESLFGLRDNKHRVYGVGFDSTPQENVSFGVSYSREKYLALSRSRQADNAAQQLDESRNWAVDSDDGTHSLVLNANFLQLADKLDVMLAWDISRSKATYQYITGAVPGRTLPEETPGVIPILPTPTQLPDVISNLNRGTLDFVYSLTPRLGLGVSYWYEKYEVEDWALDAEATKNLVITNAAGTNATAILLGYLYRPYTAQTGWVRLIVRW